MLEDRCLLSAIQFAQPVYRIAEGTRTVDVTLTRDNARDADSVLVVATGGTAEARRDYWPGAFPVNAVFQPGQREVTVTLVIGSPMGDQVLEGVETVELGLVDNDYGDVTFGEQSTATIEIHDASLSIDSPSQYVHEDGGPHTFTVVLHMADGFALSEDAVFEVSIDNGVLWPAVWFPDGIRRGAVSPNDYVLNTTRIRFTAGSRDGATQTITLTPIRDNVQEGIEGFFIRLKQISGTPFQRHVQSPGAKIIDVPEEQIGNPGFVPISLPPATPSPPTPPPPPPPPPTNFQPPLTTIEFRQPVYRIAEGTRTVEVTLVRDRTGGSDSVLVVATGGTATPGGADYWQGAFPVNAIFQPGQREVTVTLVLMSPRGGNVLEGVETIELGLIDNDHYNVAFSERSTATIEIHDAFLSIDEDDYIKEDGGPQSITVTLNMADGVALQEDAVFDIRIKTDIVFAAVVHPDGIRRSVASPNDYQLWTEQIRFAAGSGNGATQTIVFTPLADDRPEGIESFYFEFEQAGGPPFGRHRSPILSIIDVPEESIDRPPPFVVLPGEGRRDDDVAADRMSAPAENSAQGTSSPGVVSSLIGTVPAPTGSPSAVLIAAETPSSSVPGLQPAEPVPLGRMDLLAEFLNGPDSVAELDEPRTSGSGTTTFAATAGSSQTENLDSAFSDDDLLADLILLPSTL